MKYKWNIKNIIIYIEWLILENRTKEALELFRLNEDRIKSYLKAQKLY